MDKTETMWSLLARYAYQLEMVFWALNESGSVIFDRVRKASVKPTRCNTESEPKESITVIIQKGITSPLNLAVALMTLQDCVNSSLF